MSARAWGPIDVTGSMNGSRKARLAQFGRPPVDVHREEQRADRRPSLAMARAGSSPSSGTSPARSGRSSRRAPVREASAPSACPRRLCPAAAARCRARSRRSTVSSRSRAAGSARPGRHPDQVPGGAPRRTDRPRPALEPARRRPTRRRSARSAPRRRARIGLRSRPHRVGPSRRRALPRACPEPAAGSPSTRSSRDAGSRAASRWTSTAGSIQPPACVGAATPMNVRRPAAASATSRARAERKAPAPGSCPRRGSSPATSSPAAHASRTPATSDLAAKPLNTELSRRARIGPRALCDRRRESRELLRPFRSQPADRIQHALDVVGRFARLQHRDGDIDELLDRRDRHDRPARIDRRGALGRGRGGGPNGRRR